MRAIVNCSVCGNPNKCYALVEFGPPRPAVIVAVTSFFICTECLVRLVDPIKTEKTKIHDLNESPIKFINSDKLKKIP